MGKKRIVTQQVKGIEGLKARALSKIPKKKLTSGVLHIHATYNNTKLVLTDQGGKVIMWSTSGALGFSGAKKSTPYAAAKVGELMAEKSEMIGLKDIDVVIKGVGPGRESALRAFLTRGFNLRSITDKTPVPFNGPRKRRPRRV